MIFDNIWQQASSTKALFAEKFLESLISTKKLELFCETAEAQFVISLVMLNVLIFEIFKIEILIGLASIISIIYH